MPCAPPAGCALRLGRHAQHHRFALYRRSGFLVSGKGGVPPLPSSTRLSREQCKQRGHAAPPVAALGGNAASPLSVMGWSVLSASGHGGVPPWPSIQSAGQRRRRAASHGSALPLRPHATLLHKAAFPKVWAVAALKLRLVPTPLRALRVSETGLMQSGLRLAAGASAVGAPRSWVHALRAAAWSPWCCATYGFAVRRFARCFSQWPAASMECCSPPPTRRGLAAARHWPPAPAARPPPRGLPHPALGEGAGQGFALPLAAANLHPHWDTRDSDSGQSALFQWDTFGTVAQKKVQQLPTNHNQELRFSLWWDVVL